MQRFDWWKLLSLRIFYQNCRLHARSLQVWNDHVPIYCLAVYRAIRMCAKKVTRALLSYLEFHGMSAVTYAVKVICIGESKRRLEGMLRLFSGSVENGSAECGVWKIWSVENSECGKWGVWKTESVENAEC